MRTKKFHKYDSGYGIAEADLSAAAYEIEQLEAAIGDLMGKENELGDADIIDYAEQIKGFKLDL